jgi:hypothetical protein
MKQCAVVLSCFLLVFPACFLRPKIVQNCQEKVICAVQSDDALMKEEPSRSPDKVAYSACDVELKAAEMESKFNDIPVPLGSMPIADYVMTEMPENKGAMFGYVSTLSQQKLFQFFTHECTRLGWRLCSQICHVEVLLCFKKPDCYCSVNIRPYDERTQAIIISMMPKS